MDNHDRHQALNSLIATWILESTTRAGSGHPTSSLSALHLMSALFFARTASGEPLFRYDINNPEYLHNDRLIFSKGHAAPLYYALFAAAGAISEEELMTLRTMDSNLEGHPTRRFPFTEVPTGSLGQGLSAAVGEALALRAQHSTGRVFVLLGDSEMAEGQIYEAMQLAAYDAVDHLIAIVDVNRLGQRGETMVGRNSDVYIRRAEAFGWRAIAVENGHDMNAIIAAYTAAMRENEGPVMIVAQTRKGYGLPFAEDQNGWHGRALTEEELRIALEAIGPVDRTVRGELAVPSITLSDDDNTRKSRPIVQESSLNSNYSGAVAPRVAYGEALASLCIDDAAVVALDAETGNSTKAAAVLKHTPEQFYEMFIAEQNMVSVAVGMARRGLRPFVSTFAAFLTRAADQIRMAQYAEVDITFTGSHPGVSIGADGSSQMGLEDLALFGALRESVILYPSDAVSAAACVHTARTVSGLSYVRMTREALPILYDNTAAFPVGGSHVLRQSSDDAVTVCAAGVTVWEALAAADTLAQNGIAVRVIDCYSIRPLDTKTIRTAAAETQHLVVVEDHYEHGGLGDQIRRAVCGMAVSVTHHCVRIAPHSGTPQELRSAAEIDAAAIVRSVHAILNV